MQPKKRQIVWLAVPVFIGCGISGDGTPGPKDSAVPKNLLIVSVDTLRADALGYAGWPDAQTPNLDALAASGISFGNAIAPMPRTTPALGSLLTGLWPQHHGSREVGDPILETVQTLGERLREVGFVTLGVSTNDSAGQHQGLDRGFDRFISYRDQLAHYGDGLYHEKSPALPQDTGWAAATTESTLGMVDELGLQSNGDPYFLWVFYFDPHFLYRPPSPWQEQVQAAGCWDLYAQYQDQIERAGEVFADIGGVATEVLEDCRRLYQAEVAYTDFQIGALIRGLEKRGLLEETLVVFTADHGENFGEGGLFFEHGDNAREAGLRVPLVFSGPGVAVNRTDPTAVSLVDVAPTVLDLLSVPVGQALDGESLAERVVHESPKVPSADRIVFAESASALWNVARGPLVTGSLGGRVCINGPRWTLCEEQKQRTLFDRKVDPTMTNDLFDQHPDEVDRLSPALVRWPAESARERVARTARFKLVQYPRLEGGYRTELYDLAGPGEGIDVSGQFERVASILEEALEDWAAGIPIETLRKPNPEREQILRNLGYMK